MTAAKFPLPPKLATRTAAGLLTLMGAGALILATAAPASASPAPTADDPHPTASEVVKVPMTAETITGVEPTSNGAVAELSNGESIDLPQKAYTQWEKNKDKADTKDLVPGDCGYSYLWLFDQGNLDYRLWTGFHVEETAWYYGWESSVVGRDNDYSQLFIDEGEIDSQDWSQEYFDTVPESGFYSGVVEFGWAFMSNFQICTAAEPSDTQPIL